VGVTQRTGPTRLADAVGVFGLDLLGLLGDLGGPRGLRGALGPHAVHATTRGLADGPVPTSSTLTSHTLTERPWGHTRLERPHDHPQLPQLPQNLREVSHALELEPRRTDLGTGYTRVLPWWDTSMRGSRDRRWKSVMLTYPSAIPV